MNVGVVVIIFPFFIIIITCPFSMANRQESAGKLLLALPGVVGEQEEEKEEEEESLPWSNVIVGGGGVFPTQNICQVNAQNAKGKFIIGRLPCDL